MAQNDPTQAATPAAATPDTAATPAAAPADPGVPPSPSDQASSAPAEGSVPATDPKPGAGDVLDTDAADDAQGSTDGDVLADADSPDDEGVPDSYTFDLSDAMSEAGVTIDEEKLEPFKALAKDLGLTQKQFQGAVEYDLQRTQEAVTFWSDKVNGWREGARTDTEFGGESYKSNVKAVLGVVEQFGDAEFKAMIKSPSPENPDGLAIGNHPAFLRTMNRIAKKLGDPSLILGDDVQKSDANEAKLKRLYPSMFKESA